MTRFELATPRPPDVYSTELSYIPMIVLMDENSKFQVPNSKIWQEVFYLILKSPEHIK